MLPGEEMRPPKFFLFDGVSIKPCTATTRERAEEMALSVATDLGRHIDVLGLVHLVKVRPPSG